MSKFKGTQGYWKSQNIFENHVVTDDKDNVLDIRGNEYNAKLIAAAPKLLAFAIEIVKRYPNSPWIIDEGQQAIDQAL